MGRNWPMKHNWPMVIEGFRKNWPMVGEKANDKKNGQWFIGQYWWKMRVCPWVSDFRSWSLRSRSSGEENFDRKMCGRSQGLSIINVWGLVNGPLFHVGKLVNENLKGRIGQWFVVLDEKLANDNFEWVTVLCKERLFLREKLANDCVSLMSGLVSWEGLWCCVGVVVSQ